jgi:subtilisin family serine protease
VKFKKPVADTIEQQLESKTPFKNLKLTKSLNNLNVRHKVKLVEPLIKNFKANRERVNNLLKKNVNQLSSDEKRILRRQQRAPKNAKDPELGRIYIVKLEEGQSVEQAIADYNKDPSVEYAELNYKVSIYLTPDDANYPQQWSLNNTGQEYPDYYSNSPGTPGCDINAPKSWDITTGSEEIVVAVIDTGVDYRHRDLALNMWSDENGNCGYDFVNNGMRLLRI